MPLPGPAPVHPDSQLQAAVVLEEEEEQPKSKTEMGGRSVHCRSLSGVLCRISVPDGKGRCELDTCLNEGEYWVHFPNDAF